MAKAIRDIKRTQPTPEEIQAQVAGDIIKAVTEHKEAILDMLAIVGSLHEMGVLSALKALLSQRQEVASIAMKQLNQPKMHHMMKNAMTAVQLLGTIQPEHLQKWLNGVSKGLETSKEATEGNPSGVWELMKAMREPEVRASMGMMVGFLRGMGESIQNEDSSPTH